MPVSKDSDPSGGGVVEQSRENSSISIVQNTCFFPSDSDTRKIRQDGMKMCLM